ncbi:uncharacterized protein LOC123989256 [Osmia bicornis bicornis]|uniref:uncharacterized protein LOC123989256 n=1 Tax=Osmia bicornis bicornis TaxID=1437191 RepID=UPI001EAF0492|nr:uncharacterized protein LOC123989256 [Osmia bicornis bicornis]
MHLEQEILPVLSDNLESPPENGKYEAIKNRITTVFAETTESRLRRLLHGHELGDEKPSVFLQKMKHLSAGQCNDSILRSLFLEQTPSNVRTILAISEMTDLTKLALQADKILKMAHSNSVAAIDTKPTTSGQNLPPDTLSDEVAELRRLVEALTVNVCRNQFRNKPFGRRRERSTSRSRFSRNYSQNSHQMCYYHRRFGNLARRCKQSCNFVKPQENSDDRRRDGGRWS